MKKASKDGYTSYIYPYEDNTVSNNIQYLNNLKKLKYIFKNDFISFFPTGTSLPKYDDDLIIDIPRKSEEKFKYYIIYKLKFSMCYTYSVLGNNYDYQAYKIENYDASRILLNFYKIKSTTYRDAIL